MLISVPMETIGGFTLGLPCGKERKGHSFSDNENTENKKLLN